MTGHGYQPGRSGPRCPLRRAAEAIAGGGARSLMAREAGMLLHHSVRRENGSEGHCGKGELRELASLT